MKLNKYIICTSVIAIISIGGLIIGNVNKKAVANRKYEVTQAYNNTINQSGIEHVISVDENFTFDIYRDRSNGKERSDYYDENGLLVNRTISTDFGASFLILSQYKNEKGEWDYSLSKTIPPREAVLENKEITKKTIIPTYLGEELVNVDWKSSNRKGDLIKYSRKGDNLYINSKTGIIEKRELSKRELISKKEILETVDIEILDLNQANINDVFEIDAPLVKENSIVGNKNIKAIISSLKIEVHDSTDEEYDSSNGKG